MGLNFRLSKTIEEPVELKWSYRGFNYFRKRIARLEGIGDLDAIYDEHPIGDPWWSTLKTPIVPLLNHSDCDGALSPEECDAVEPRLREIVLAFPDGDYDNVNGLLLCDAMQTAAAEGWTLVFC